MNTNRRSLSRLSASPQRRSQTWLLHAFSRAKGQPPSLSTVATIEKRQGAKIASPEEIAFRKGYIDAAHLERLIATQYPNNDYGRYLRSVIEDVAAGD